MLVKVFVPVCLCGSGKNIFFGYYLFLDLDDVNSAINFVMRLICIYVWIMNYAS